MLRSPVMFHNLFGNRMSLVGVNTHRRLLQHIITKTLDTVTLHKLLTAWNVLNDGCV